MNILAAAILAGTATAAQSVAPSTNILTQVSFREAATTSQPVVVRAKSLPENTQSAYQTIIQKGQTGPKCRGKKGLVVVIR